LEVPSDARRSASSLPAVCSLHDRADRKSGVPQRRNKQQQSTDSAIGASLEDVDDVLSTPSSASSSRLSLLQLCATPTARCDVISRHATSAAKLRRGMTLSGDDLFPSRMRDSLLMTACFIGDNTGRPTVDDITKHRDEPSKPTSEITIIHPPLEQPKQREEGCVSASGELETRRRMNWLIQRQLNNCQGYKNQDSGKSTSDDYTSDYEDKGAKFRWRDKSPMKSVRQRDLHQRRSYSVTRRRRDVNRSQSDSVRTSRG